MSRDERNDALVGCDDGHRDASRAGFEDATRRAVRCVERNDPEWAFEPVGKGCVETTVRRGDRQGDVDRRGKFECDRRLFDKINDAIAVEVQTLDEHVRGGVLIDGSHVAGRRDQGDAADQEDRDQAGDSDIPDSSRAMARLAGRMVLGQPTHGRRQWGRSNEACHLESYRLLKSAHRRAPSVALPGREPDSGARSRHRFRASWRSLGRGRLPSRRGRRQLVPGCSNGETPRAHRLQIGRTCRTGGTPVGAREPALGVADGGASPR